MSYLVLARKWRPQSFADLLGQDHVRRTLENAISQGRVAHAFLFTGVRGVGKTTSARILAKTLNCQQGPTATPCLTCAQCVEITAGNDVDVQELDGASYNGVDEVRRLQESLPYRPARDRFKIYIVDEVHMLSNAAWNAFLKTLEEPPPHVKFIFATTEVHKVPITILSRCQRYDFKMISAQTIAQRIAYVLEQERIEADQAAISLIAREAAGSMRDAMSLLDQAIAWGGDKLEGEQVARVLGVASRSALLRLCTHLVEGDAEGCLKLVHQLVENGQDLAHVSRDLLSMLRDLVVARVCNDPGALLDVSEDEKKATLSLASRAQPDDLVRLHQGFSRSFDDIVRSQSPRAGLEMTLVRLARRPALLPFDDLLTRLDALERRLTGAPPPHGSPPSAGPGGPGAGGPGAGKPPTAQAAPAQAAPPSSPASPALGGSLAGPPAGPPPSRPQLSVARPAPPSSPMNSAQAPMPRRGNLAAVPAEPFPSAPPAPPPAPPATMAMPRTLRPVFAAPPPSATPEPPPEPPPAPAPRQVVQRGPGRTQGALANAHDPTRPLPPPPPGVDFAAWHRVVDRVRAAKPSLASVLEFAVPLKLDAESVVLGFPTGSFISAQASEPRNTEILKDAVTGELGPAAVSIELSDSAAQGLTIGKLKARDAYERREAARKRVIEHPIVRAAIDLLQAELRDVKVEEDKPGGGKPATDRGR